MYIFNLFKLKYFFQIFVIAGDIVDIVYRQIVMWQIYFFHRLKIYYFMIPNTSVLHVLSTLFFQQLFPSFCSYSAFLSHISFFSSFTYVNFSLFLATETFLILILYTAASSMGSHASLVAFQVVFHQFIPLLNENCHEIFMQFKKKIVVL